ncbi:hypothetical protein [Chitinophaga sp. S165]|uniref:hypothetical protein n=1 Tax=Chitinophaga sp. S165 TaxID=2135462 RepID=UPI000D87D3A8|nr:hypothetical protein [Chitinophaga sp. S165]PWV47751.1 hypothetical protein C7475_108321 [Chitinophaga sp. S165]
MKRYLLLLLLFLANSVSATSISYFPFSKMLTECKAYYICRYLRTERDSLVLADRHSGKEFIVSRKGHDDPAGDSYLVAENEANTYVVRSYPYSKENDEIVARLSSRIRDIDKMRNSKKKINACKEWIFSLMDVPFLRWYGFYEWEDNQIIGDYKALKKRRKSSSFNILTPQESERLYKAFLTYRWPNFYTWDVVWLLDSSYNDRVVKYVCQFLEWTLSEEAEDFEYNDGSMHSTCEYCGVYVLSAAGLGGEEFLKIADEYDKDSNKFTSGSDKVYIRRMVEALKKQFSR